MVQNVNKNAVKYVTRNEIAILRRILYQMKTVANDIDFDRKHYISITFTSNLI